MGDVLTDIINWMDALSPIWAYAVILSITYGENIIPPVPGDMVVVFGGVLAGRGQLDYGMVVLLSAFGGTAGFMTVYALGYYVGQTVLEADRVAWLSGRQVDRVRQWVRRWGYGVVLANRFLSGARSVISLTVGMVRMDPWKTTGYAACSAVVWTALIAYAGYQVGENWQAVAVYLRDYGRLVAGLIMLTAIVQLIRYYRKRRAARKGQQVTSAMGSEKRRGKSEKVG